MKNKLDLEDLRDIVIMMMMQKNGLFGWRFVERISKCEFVYLNLCIAWNDDKLQEFVKLILEDENYDDIGRGSDCGLFEIFPHLENHVTIREVLEKESDDDSVGSLVDFIDDDLGEEDDDDESDDDEEEDDESDDCIDLIDEDDEYDDEEEEEYDRKRKKRSEPVKRRKMVVISDSD